MPGDFEFRNLTAETRECMLREIEQDIADDVLVKSKRFTEAGSTGYPPLLRSAASEYNEAWLAESLTGSFNTTEVSAGRVVAMLFSISTAWQLLVTISRRFGAV